MASTFETSICIGDNDIDIEVKYEAWWQRAKTYGPPEDCYEAEGDMEILSVVPLQDLPEGMTEAQFQDHCERCNNCIEEKAWEDYHEQD